MSTFIPITTEKTAGVDVDYQNPVLLKQGTDSSTHGTTQFLVTILNMTKAETKEIVSKYKRLIAYQECPFFKYGGTSSNKYYAWRIASIYDLTVVNEECLSMLDYPIFDIESYTWPITHRSSNLKLAPKFLYYNYRDYDGSSDNSHDYVYATRQLVHDNAAPSNNSLSIEYDGSSQLTVGFTQNIMPNSGQTPTRTYRVYGVE